MPRSLAEIQPVRRGLTAAEHAPGRSEGAVGGSGSALTLTGSGDGAAGLAVAPGGGDRCCAAAGTAARIAATARAKAVNLLTAWLVRVK